MDANTTQTITKSGASAKKKEKFKDASNLSVVKAYVIGNGAVGSPKAFYLVTDSVSYLFNCGEMTQRMSTQLKLRLNKLDNIFITNSVWENIGGIPGMALTRQDANAEFLNIHGPGGLGEMFQLMKSFVCIKNLQINVMETARGGSFNDGIMDIKFVPIYPSEENTGVEESYFSENTDEDKADGDDETSVDYCDYLRESLDKDISLTISEEKYCCNVRDQSQKPSICYVCKTPDILGKLNLEACAKRNIPTGPLFGKLKKKENIILPNGESVNYKDVTFPDVPGKIFLVVDCPKRRYLDALLQEPILMEYQMAVDPAKIPVLIVHFSHPSVMNDPKYVQWMSSFPQVTKHLRLNEDNVDVGTPPTHKLQTKLNLVHEEIFPRLPNPAIPLVRSVQELKKDGDETTQNIPVNFECSFLEGRTLMCIDLKNFNISQDPSFALWPEEYVQEALSEEGASQTLENLKKELNQLQLDLDTKGDYPKFLFLGTGSSCPQSIRNTSGILVFTTENTCMLLDCGEGTYNQLIIFFGNKIAEEVLLKLKAVFISHMHADHHLGFLGILKGRRRAIDNHFKKVKCSPEFQNTPTTEMVSKLNIKPLYLVGPNAIKVYLKLYHSIFEEVLPDFRTIPSSAFKVLFYLHKKETSASSVKKKSPPSPAMLKNFLEDVRLKELKTTYVRHCSEAYGVSFVTENNFKVTYSGDCMPSGNLIELGRDSDILIHEATMDNDRKEDAVRKLHSTTDQALQVGKKMNAKFTMLTHFSQRYVYLPRCTESFLENVGVAFDMMTFTMKQIALIPKLMPALRLIFAEKIREMDQKYLKSESSKNIMGPSLKRKAADVPSDRLSRYQLSSFPVKTRQTFNLIQVKRDFSRYNNEFTGEMAVEYPRMVMVVHKNSWNQIPI